MSSLDVSLDRGWAGSGPSAAVGGALTPLAGAAAVLMLFVALYPPFLYTPDSPEGVALRLALEAAVLLSLALYLAMTHAQLWVAVLCVFCLYMLNLTFSQEAVGNVLSHFNKFALLLLLSGTFRKHKRFTLLCTRIWVRFWLYCVVAGLITFVLVVSHLVPPNLVGQVEGYEFYSYPLLGNFLYKSAAFTPVPRYCGYLSEPINLGFFFGFNMVAAQILVSNPRKRRRFLVANFLGGLLTVSYIFGIFLVFYSVLRVKWIARFVSNKAIAVLFAGAIVAGATVLVVVALDRVGALLPYSSAGDRVQRYVLSVDFLRHASASVLLFGAGILPFHNAIGEGASAGLLDVFASRGIILLLVWLYVLRDKTKRIPGLFAYVLLYSLVWDFWHFPLFISGLTIVDALAAPGGNQGAETAGALPAAGVFA